MNQDLYICFILLLKSGKEATSSVYRPFGRIIEVGKPESNSHLCFIGVRNGEVEPSIWRLAQTLVGRDDVTRFRYWWWLLAGATLLLQNKILPYCWSNCVFYMRSYLLKYLPQLKIQGELKIGTASISPPLIAFNVIFRAYSVDYCSIKNFG